MPKGEKITVEALYDGENPQGIRLEAEETGDPGVYQEIRIGAFVREDCIADVLVGLNGEGELRVLITTDRDGDGDHEIAVYPERPRHEAVELNKF
jgi:hypothetical protein